MATVIQLQITKDAPYVPTRYFLKKWAISTLKFAGNLESELTIRVVPSSEMQNLNRRFRHISSPTNVLAFPYDDLPGVTTSLLGDVVICAEVVQRETEQLQSKPNHRWAHMVIHGILHLCGYDHQNQSDALTMTEAENRLLSLNGFGH